MCNWAWLTIVTLVVIAFVSRHEPFSAGGYVYPNPLGHYDPAMRPSEIENGLNVTCDTYGCSYKKYA
jgi:hypothetical protein